MNNDFLEPRREQLYQLLPRVYKVLDEVSVPADKKGPLRELLSSIGEQVNLLEDDMNRWYDNWFIETCENWVVPYLGDLVGYESASRDLNTEQDPESPLNRAVVFPRREVADTVAFRRHKGTLAILEELSRRVVGWPARAVEFRETTAGSAALNHLHRQRSSTVDMRDRQSLHRLNSPFDALPRSVDLRRVNSRRTPGRHNLPGIGLHVYRRKIGSATFVPTCAVKNRSERRTVDATGLDLQLHVNPEHEGSPYNIAQLMHLPVPLTRQMLRREVTYDERFERRHVHSIVGANPQYYGLGKSVTVIVKYDEDRYIVPARDLVVTDLSRWGFFPSEAESNLVAIDPELGRLAFHVDNPPSAVWTVHHYGRSANMGGGEYDRQLHDTDGWRRVQRDPHLRSDRCRLIEAMHLWNEANGSGVKPPDHTVIEIADNEEHSAEVEITIPGGKTLEIRAANHFRPLLTVPDTTGQDPETFHFKGQAGSRLVLDGLLFGKGELLLDGEFESVLIRHCTFAPRTTITCKLNATEFHIEHSIIGEFISRTPDAKHKKKQIPQLDYPYNEPIRLCTRDSILDGQGCAFALSGSDVAAHAKLNIVRSTVFGQIKTYSAELIEDSLLCDHVCIENVLTGCARFSYVAPTSCTPPQFHCQPSYAVSRLGEAASRAPRSTDDAVPDSERVCVAPRLVSRTYGNPDFARLADDCPLEILMGASDEGEMGVYHNEFYTQRAVHLRQRLQEFVPAGSDAEISFEN